MTRVTTTNYAGGGVNQQFAWATDGGDKFSREQDLYRLAQALEAHDHTNGKGLPVGRLASAIVAAANIVPGSLDAGTLAVDAITAIAVALDAIGALELADNAVDTNAIQALAVTLAKLAANSVDASKVIDGSITNAELAAGVAIANLGYTPVNKAGDSSLGDMTYGSTKRIIFTQEAADKILLAAAGAYKIGVGSGSVENQTDTTFKWRNDTDSVGTYAMVLDADAKTLLIGGQQAYTRADFAAPTSTPTAGRIPVADGAGKLDGWITAAAAGIASGAGVFFTTAAGIASGYTRHTALDGRIPVGAGVATGPSNPVTFVEATNYGANSQHSHQDNGGTGHTHSGGSLGVSGTTGASNDNQDLADTGSGTIMARNVHAHDSGGLDVTGSTDGTATSISNATDQPVVRAVVWATKN